MHPQDPTGQPSQTPQQPGSGERPAAGPTPGPGARMMHTGYAPPPPGYQPPFYPPPGYPAPGPMMMGPAPMGPYGMPPRKRNGARTFFTIVGVLVLCVSLLLNLLLFGTLGATMMGADDPGTVQTTVFRGDSKNKVALLPVEGIINNQTADLMNRWLDSVQRDPDVRAVILAVDTPGGGVTASDQIHARLERFRREKGIPIVVTMGALATSGGYYVSANADHIFAQHTTLTGNIGVLMPRYNLSELVKKWGISESTITAPRNGYKNAGSMFQPESPKDTEYLQGLIDEMYSRFAGIVAKGRTGKLKGSINSIANGQVYTASKAVDNGLVDKIGDLTDALAYLQSDHAISNPTVIKYQRRMTFLDALTGVESKVPSINVHGVEVKLDAQSLQELTTPRPMYLWRGE